jgi:hypothetical protein
MNFKMICQQIVHDKKLTSLLATSSLNHVFDQHRTGHWSDTARVWREPAGNRGDIRVNVTGKG